MNSRHVLKAGAALGGGMIFWAIFVMVFIVYAFFPAGTKDLNQAIFLVAFPSLYLITSTFIMSKIFSDSNWKLWLTNLIIIIIMAALALGLVMWMVKIMEFVLGG